MAHTPGPWEIAEARTPNDRVWPTINSLSEPYAMHGYQGFRTIALVNGSSLGDKQANARLITAAPELLEALKDVLETFSLRDAFHSKQGSHGEAVVKGALAAIAKAEGRS